MGLPGSLISPSNPLRCARVCGARKAIFLCLPGTCSSARKRASETYRATIIRPWRDWSIADESLLYFSSEWEEQNRHPALRRVSPFLCRGGAKRKPARAFARRDCTVRRANFPRLDARRVVGRVFFFWGGGGGKRRPEGPFAGGDCTVVRKTSRFRQGRRSILGILPLPLASPSASSGSFVVGQDDRGKKARRGTHLLRSPVLKSMGWARTLIRT